MPLIPKALIVLFVSLGTFYFVYWVPLSLLPFEINNAVAFIVSLALAAAVGRYVWRAFDSDRRGLLKTMLLGAVLIGVAGFLLGFIGPIILAPQASQGPLLGLLITGPLGFIVGAIGGAVYWTTRRRNRED